MGNWWKGASEEKLRRAELGLFENVGMNPHTDLVFADVPIWQNQQAVDVNQNYIHEIRVKPTREGLPPLVMIHGFGGGGAVFYKMIKHLREHFSVITIDLLGQGMSGRPRYEIKHDFDATIAYFTESIHAWVQQSGLVEGGKKFILLGHSMGGMFVGHYALKYPQHVSQLVFMSSVGISVTPEWAKPNNVLASLESGLGRFGARFAIRQLNGATMTPQDFYRMMGDRFGQRGIKNGMQRRMDPTIFGHEDEMDNLATYVYQMMVRGKSSEQMLNRIVTPFVFTHKCLEDRLHELPDIPMAFMYGEYDWVSRESGDRLISSGKVKGEVFQTADSAHHLYMEAAEECVACIIKFIHGEEAANEFVHKFVQQA